MRFYTGQHQFTCGIDLHGKNLYACVIDEHGEVCFHQRMPCSPDRLSKALKPYSADVVVGVECTFSWYWLADWCSAERIPFMLGHATDMKAVHGAKSGNDRLDALRIASLLRGGCFPVAYVYPRSMRAARDLLRRRCHLVHKRSELLVHIENTNTQYNLSAIPGRLSRPGDREGVADRFEDSCARLTVEADLEVIAQLDATISRLEKELIKIAKAHDRHAFHLLKTVPGIGDILAMTILYEIHTVDRFDKVGGFLSYARLVKCLKTSNNKIKGVGSSKAGNAHLKWAFSQAAALFLRGNLDGQALHSRLVKRHGRPKAMGILAAKIARASFFMLKHHEPFDRTRFYAT